MATVSPMTIAANTSACRAAAPASASESTTPIGTNGRAAGWIASRHDGGTLLSPEMLLPPCSSGTRRAYHPSSAVWVRVGSIPVSVSASSRTLVSGQLAAMNLAVVSRRLLAVGD